MLGRWDQADHHLSAILERDRLTGTKGVHTRWRRARLDIARGDFAAARRWLESPAQPAPAAEAAAPSVGRSLGLTRRETEVLALLAEGQTNRQIGQELYITEKTASVHVSRILAKLGVAGRGEAAAIAHRLGLDRH
jgi:DNA-binding NarL/FixJ family response regulator